MISRSIFTLCAAACVVLAGCAGSGSTPAGVSQQPGLTLRPPGTASSIASMTVTSSSFVSGTIMPANAAQIGCGSGANISPQLSWSGAPAGTKSFVLTEFDQDAPTGVGFWHWTLFNIPPAVTSLAVGAGTSPPAGSVSGLTDYGTPGYGGPCPPTGDGAHRYTFTVSALDEATLPGVNAGATGAFITFNMRGHILAQGTYLGLFAL